MTDLLYTALTLVMVILFAKGEQNAPHSFLYSEVVIEEPYKRKAPKTTKPLEQRAKQLNNELRTQRRMSWTEFKNNNATVNNYLINKQAIP